MSCDRLTPSSSAFVLLREAASSVCVPRKESSHEVFTLHEGNHTDPEEHPREIGAGCASQASPESIRRAHG
jgi:hypothetical protein